jgi:hypothetical protein
VSFALGIFFECVRHRNGSVAQVLSVHRFDGGVRRLEAGEIDEGESLRVATLGVPHDLWCLQDHSEGGERVVQQLLVHFGVQVADEDVCSDVEVLLVSGCLRRIRG